MKCGVSRADSVDDGTREMIKVATIIMIRFDCDKRDNDTYHGSEYQSAVLIDMFELIDR